MKGRKGMVLHDSRQTGTPGTVADQEGPLPPRPLNRRIAAARPADRPRGFGKLLLHDRLTRRSRSLTSV